MEIKGNLSPTNSRPELPKIPTIPGFEGLREGAMRNILEWAKNSGFEEVDPTNLNDLTKIPIDTLIKLEKNKNYFGLGGSISYCIPDKGQAIRKALKLRRELLQEAARHAGANISDPDDVNTALEDIRISQHGPDRSNEEEFPF